MTTITTENVIRMELRTACSQDVYRLLFEYVEATSLNAATKSDLLEHIKSVAVKCTHKEVDRMKFFRLSQMDGETITQYVARLLSQAVLCQFKVACTNHDQQTLANYLDYMITQQLILGLKNQQNQSRILSETTALPTLQQKIERLQCLESTEQSTDLIRSIMPRPSHSITTPMKSSYKRSKTPHQLPGSRSQPPAKGCGRFSHEGKTMVRKDCPAI